MKIPQIQIQTTKAKLGLKITDAVAELRQPKADLTIRQPRPEVSVQQTDAKLLLDTTQGRRDLGLYNPLEFSQKQTSRAKGILKQGISRRAQEGEQLMRIENGGRSPIPAIAKSNANPPPKAIGIKFVPSTQALNITYQEGSLDINVTPQKAQINAQVNKPQVNYNPWDVSGYMIQYPSISIDVKA